MATCALPVRRSLWSWPTIGTSPRMPASSSRSTTQWRLTPVVDFEQAAADTVNLVHPERGTNVMSRGGVDHPELDAIFASAPHVFTETIRQDRQSQVPMEPHGIIVRWKEYDRELHVWSSCQRVHEVRATWCRVLGVGEHSIHVTQRDVGGGFGQKGAMRTEEIATAIPRVPDGSHPQVGRGSSR